MLYNKRSLNFSLANTASSFGFTAVPNDPECGVSITVQCVWHTFFFISMQTERRSAFYLHTMIQYPFLQHSKCLVFFLHNIHNESNPLLYFESSSSLFVCRQTYSVEFINISRK